ncbi:alpha/beta fold hydrolase [Streptomyces spongiae]|uniref:alpha/beta fold hydrolase n=1 Tax=Streptomyces spongiae TaxID=565072 RepID=UPI00389B23A3
MRVERRGRIVRICLVANRSARRRGRQADPGAVVPGTASGRLVPKPSRARGAMLLTTEEPRATVDPSAPSVYVVCTKDRTVRVGAQRECAAHATESIEIDCDHSPFFSAPDRLAALLAEQAGRPWSARRRKVPVGGGPGTSGLSYGTVLNRLHEAGTEMRTSWQTRRMRQDPQARQRLAAHLRRFPPRGTPRAGASLTRPAAALTPNGAWPPTAGPAKTTGGARNRPPSAPERSPGLPSWRPSSYRPRAEAGVPIAARPRSKQSPARVVHS